MKTFDIYFKDQNNFYLLQKNLYARSNKEAIKKMKLFVLNINTLVAIEVKNTYPQQLF